LLTAGLVTLAYRTSFAVLLDVAQCASTTCAALHFLVVSILLWLIAGATIFWKKLRSEGKHTAELTQLRAIIVNAIAMTLLLLALATAAAYPPFLMRIMTEIPEFGTLSGIGPGIVLLHRINLSRLCSRFTEAMTAAQRAAERTMVA